MFQVIKIGGTFVLQIQDCYYGLTAQVLFLLSIHFKHVRMVLPKVQNGISQSRYLVCKEFKHTQKQKADSLRLMLEKLFSAEAPRVDSLAQNQKKLVSILDLSPQIQSSEWFSNCNQRIKEFNKIAHETELRQISKFLTALESSSAAKESSDEERQRLSDQADQAIAWCKKYSIPFLSLTY